METTTMNHSRGVHLLAELIDVDPSHVARAVSTAARAHRAIHESCLHELTGEQLRRLVERDRFALAIVANLAMRFAGRSEDAMLLMDIYRASVGTQAHPMPIRKGVGTRPEHHDHPYVQRAIRILQAAGLPPLHTDGIHALRWGFQVQPAAEELPGWIFINPDPDCDERTGFAGGRRGYLAVMRWAGWGVITEPVYEGLLAAVHPDHRNNTFHGPSNS
ncbi:hypothetical protein [Streptomyces rhizosphaericus]|uniref:Uncharacterized protein n=1 Tax=Streptomyces rhizosphaericus TaxID=114699 RepID=A0A6G4AGK2_9ACTN|nr:hypothetical protein [Streptomyces rhizosphaericus]NEW72566.1 hypothetical protein [Streptomyces rhizosphaericus]